MVGGQEYDHKQEVCLSCDRLQSAIGRAVVQWSCRFDRSPVFESRRRGKSYAVIGVGGVLCDPESRRGIADGNGALQRRSPRQPLPDMPLASGRETGAR